MITLLTIAIFAVFIVMTLAGAIIDIRKRVIPNKLLLAMTALWIFWRVALLLLSSSEASSDILLESAELASMAFIFGGAVFAITLTYERFRGKFAMGGGDIKLITVVALYLGLESTMVCLMVASMIGIMYSLNRSSIRVRGVPFVPCIACGIPMSLLVLSL